jgi:adenosylcobinamide amidohydrolase
MKTILFDESEIQILPQEGEAIATVSDARAMRIAAETAAEFHLTGRGGEMNDAIDKAIDEAVARDAMRRERGESIGEQ